jgi:hypothetical protein
MRKTFAVPGIPSALLAGLLLTATPSTWGQQGAADGEWTTYGGDLGSTRYSALDQIDGENFSTLEVAWRFKTDNLGPRPETNLQSTPLMVDGVLYSTGGTRRAVVALDAGTGELLWKYSYNEGERGAEAPRQLSGRGLAYWTDGSEERIIYVTPGYHMIALDAEIGRPVAGFGQGGIVDLKDDMDQEMDPIQGDVGLHAAPVVAGGTIIVGAAHTPGATPESRRNEKGFVRGYPRSTATRPGRRAPGSIRGTRVSGARSASISTWDSSTCRWRCRRATTTGATVRETTCTAPASWLWIWKRASGDGTSSSSITISGTGTRRARRSWSTSR